MRTEKVQEAGEGGGGGSDANAHMKKVAPRIGAEDR